MLKTVTAWKVSKYGVFSGPDFPVLGLNRKISSSTGLLSLSSWLSVVISNDINFCIGRWHTVSSPVLDITTNPVPLTWASFPITKWFIFPIRHSVRGTFSSPIRTISPTFKTLFFECFSFLKEKKNFSREKQSCFWTQKNFLENIVYYYSLAFQMS